MIRDDDITFDFGREARVGFPEIIYGEFKSADQLKRIVAQCIENDQAALISRCGPEKVESLRSIEGGVYDPVAQTWCLQPNPPEAQHLVSVVSAGTADAPVVKECTNTLRYLGIAAQEIQDVGVAGIHRLLDRLDDLQKSDVVICVAGFEGALASVIAGQLSCPVIGVPTSVGYGVARDGLAALHAMLASCANGLSVMNIDNGVGAALAARRILSIKGS